MHSLKLCSIDLRSGYLFILKGFARLLWKSWVCVCSGRNIKWISFCLFLAALHTVNFAIFCLMTHRIQMTHITWNVSVRKTFKLTLSECMGVKEENFVSGNEDKKCKLPSKVHLLQTCAYCKYNTWLNVLNHCSCFQKHHKSVVMWPTVPTASPAAKSLHGPAPLLASCTLHLLLWMVLMLQPLCSFTYIVYIFFIISQRVVGLYLPCDPGHHLIILLL